MSITGWKGPVSLPTEGRLWQQTGLHQMNVDSTGAWIRNGIPGVPFICKFGICSLTTEKYRTLNSQ